MNNIFNEITAKAAQFWAAFLFASTNAVLIIIVNGVDNYWNYT